MNTASNILYGCIIILFRYCSGIGRTDYLAVRLSGRDGQEQWRVTDGGGWLESINSDAFVQDSACALAADGNGNVVIAGNTEGALFGNAGKRVDSPRRLWLGNRPVFLGGAESYLNWEPCSPSLEVEYSYSVPISSDSLHGAR